MLLVEGEKQAPVKVSGMSDPSYGKDERKEQRKKKAAGGRDRVHGGRVQHMNISNTSFVYTHNCRNINIGWFVTLNHAMYLLCKDKKINKLERMLCYN